MKAKIIVLGLSVLLSFTFVSGQVKPAALTNANIVKLVKGGLDNDLVLTKIESSTCKFDVSDEGLFALKKSGVPNEIIKAMMNKMEEKKVVKSDPPSPPTSTNKSISSSTGPEPETLNAIYYYNKSSQNLQGLEKTKANTVGRMKGLSSQAVFEVEGDKSPFRVPANENISFLVSLSEASGDPSGWFSLYKADSKGKKRSALWSKTSAFTGKSSSGENAMKYEVKKNGKSYEIVVSKPDKGEYFFIAMGTALKYGGQSYDAFAFGID